MILVILWRRASNARLAPWLILIYIYIYIHINTPWYQVDIKWGYEVFGGWIMPLYCLVDIFLEWTVPDGGDFTQRVAHFAVPELLHHIWYMVLKKSPPIPWNIYRWFFINGIPYWEVAASLVITPSGWPKNGGELSPVNLTVCELETMAVDGLIYLVKICKNGDFTVGKLWTFSRG